MEKKFKVVIDGDQAGWTGTRNVGVWYFENLSDLQEFVTSFKNRETQNNNRMGFLNLKITSFKTPNVVFKQIDVVNI